MVIEADTGAVVDGPAWRARGSGLARGLVPNRKAMIGLIIVGIFIVVAIFGSLISPYGAERTFDAWLPPSGAHLLGTDDYGQDVLSQLITGTRVSVEVGVFAGLLGSAIGTAVGLISGYFEGVIGELLMRLVDLLLVLPSLALIIVIAAFVPSLNNAVEIFIIAGLSWLWIARAIRSQVLSEKQRTYIDVARVSGMKHREIMVREILLNIVPVVFANTVMVTTSAILTQAGLSFLGIGNPDAISWGSMLALAFSDGAILHGAWGWVISPGICITILCYGFVLYGNALIEVRYK
ncbi:MAG TPA: ABC transporter permease [Mycobacteriales bacterium]|nr:ABC transporter permease [Mycobacteriales bacterium]